MGYGLPRLIKLSPGDLYQLGAFRGFSIAQWMGFGAEPSMASLAVTLIGSMIAAALLGMAIERFAYRPVRKYARMTTLITAIGVSLLLENLGVVIFGTPARSFPELLRNETYTLFGNAAISKSQLLIFGVSVALMLLLQWIVYRTKVGTAMRAASFNLNSAKLMGINTDAIIVFTFALGSALAAAGGVLTAQYNPTIYPLMGIITGLKAFVAAVLGGIGNIPGAVLGGLLIGAAETLVVGYGQYVGVPSTYRDAVAFAILILVLLFRPARLPGTAG